MTAPESPFKKNTRLGIEQRIKDHYIAGDMRMVDEQLDIYPTGRPRPEVSLEAARKVIRAQVELGTLHE